VFDKIGVTVSAVPNDYAEMTQVDIPAAATKGLLVTNVATRGPAYDSRTVVAKRDIIEQMLYPKQRDIRSTADLEQALSGLKSGDVATFRIYSIGAPGGNQVVSLKIP
jgi:hypothetical protein